jgi:hypothetical protein
MAADRRQKNSGAAARIAAVAGSNAPGLHTANPTAADRTDGHRFGLRWRWRAAGRIALAVAVVLAAAPAGRAGVTVVDAAVGVNRPLQLEVITRRFLLPHGGQRVRLHIGDRLLATILTGADGCGYYTYTPGQAGLFALRASSGGHTDTGRLLVTARNDRVVLIDVDGIVRSFPLIGTPDAKTHRALTGLGNRFKLIYLTGAWTAPLTRSWIAADRLPPAVLLIWEGDVTLKRLERRGVAPIAVVAGDRILSDIDDRVAQRFSFDPAAGAVTVEDWDQIEDALAPAPADE